MRCRVEPATRNRDHAGNHVAHERQVSARLEQAEPYVPVADSLDRDRRHDRRRRLVRAIGVERSRDRHR